MKIREAAEEYEFSLSERAESTQQWVHKKLKYFVAWYEQSGKELEQITAADMRKYLDGMRSKPSDRTGRELSSHTVHGHARVIRGFLYWCDREDYLARRPKLQMPRTEKKVVPTLSADQIQKMFLACEKEYTPELRVRDRAILSVLLDTGIRAGELMSLTLERTHLEVSDPHLLVKGKGFKQREVGLGKKARAALGKYTSRYRRKTTGQDVVFLTRFGQPFTLNGLDQMLGRLGKWAGLEGVRVSAHVWRHTFAMNYLRNGGDVYKLSRLLGHTSIVQTEIYARDLKQREAREGRSVLDAFEDDKRKK